MLSVTPGEKKIVEFAACAGACIAWQQSQRAYVGQNYQSSMSTGSYAPDSSRNTGHVPVGQPARRNADVGRRDPVEELEVVAKVGAIYGAVTAGLVSVVVAGVVYKGDPEQIARCTILSLAMGGATGSAASVSRRILRV